MHSLCAFIVRFIVRAIGVVRQHSVHNGAPPSLHNEAAQCKIIVRFVWHKGRARIGEAKSAWQNVVFNVCVFACKPAIVHGYSLVGCVCDLVSLLVCFLFCLFFISDKRATHLLARQSSSYETERDLSNDRFSFVSVEQNLSNVAPKKSYENS